MKYAKKPMILLLLLSVIFVPGCAGSISEQSTVSVVNTSELSEPSETSENSVDYDKYVEMGILSSRISSEETKEKIEANNWKVGHYVDEFGDETNKSYLYYICTGKFSNSAVTDADLSVSVIYDNPSKLSFKLFEYNTSTVKNPYSHNVYYSVDFKLATGLKYYLLGTMSKSGDRITIDMDDYYNLTEQLRKDQLIKVHITNKEWNINTYDFTIDTTGFNDALKYY